MSDLSERLARLTPEQRALLARRLKEKAAGSEPKPPIARAERTGARPLSFAQQRLWFLSQFEPDSPFYNMAEALRIEGPIDLAVVGRVLAALVERHEVLRTRLVTRDGQGFQEVMPPPSPDVPVDDLAALPADEREQRARRLAADEARRPFRLESELPVRMRILRLGPADHVLLLTVHHIACDGWSMGVLIREFGLLYEAFSANRPSPLPELPLQYADYAAWQAGWMQGALLEQELAYWKARLGGEVPPLDLCVDRVRPAVQTYRGAACSLVLPAGLTGAARALARGEGATLFMLLLAAFDALLHRYSGQGAILVGTPVAGRAQRELEGLVGFFVNTLVMRADVTPALTFRELLQAVRRDALGAYDHQDLPFEYLVNALHPARDTSHSPLFQVMFTLQGGMADTAQRSSLRLRPFGGGEKAAKFDLTLAVTETRETLAATLDFNVDLFERERIERMLEHYRTLLAAAVERPDTPIGVLPLLSEDERARLVPAPAAAPPAAGSCVHALIAEEAARRPDAVALVGEAGSWTYAQLNRRAESVARSLRAAGLGPERVVAICCRRSLELVAAVLGTLQSGAAYLPLDVATPPERLGDLLADAGARLVLTDAEGEARLPAGGPTRLRIDAAMSTPEDPAHDANAATVHPDQLAYVIYTSGSSGVPKGVMIPHGALVERSVRLAERYRFDAATRVLQFVSPAFDAFGEELYPTLLAGGALVVLDDPGTLPPAEFLLACERFGVSALHVPPVYAQPLLQELALEGRAARGVRVFITGGEAPPPSMLANWATLGGPEARLVNAYGPTEATITATTYDAPLHERERLAALTRVPIGRALPNVNAYVLDRGLEPVPAGNPGELYLGGAGLARGYLGAPERTAELFVPDPFGREGGRLYRTGDLVRRLDSGDLEYLGRVDEQVKIRGHRIELGEIDAALTAAPGVRDAAVVARAEADGRTRLVAYVVADDAGDWPACERRLRAALAARLPEYMLPAAWVALETMPRTRHGKLDRRALPEPPAPAADGEGLVAPRSQDEARLLAIWSDVLRRPALGVNSRFFECGGDSILAIQVVSRAARVGLTFTVKQIFQHQTIAELASVAAGAARREPSEQGEVSGPVPLLPIQRWFFEQAWTRREHFNQALLLDVAEPLEEAALRAAVEALVRHHDALRMTFRATPAGWEQHNGGFEGVVPLEVEDLPAVPEWREELTRRCARWQQAFDLSSGPLLRLVLFRGLPEGAARLLVVAHHLVVDGVSWRILLEDLERAYAQAAGGQAIVLDAKTASYKRWCEWLGEYARGGALEQEKEYWLDQARAAGDDPEEPTEDAEGEGLDTVAMELSEEDTLGLLQEPARAYGAEIHHALLAAFARAAARVSGGRAVRVELESHGREELDGAPDVTRTVGWFTTQYPVRLEAPAEAGPGDVLCAVKEQLRQVPRGGIGYGLLRHGGDEDVVRRLARGGRADASFNYLGTLDQGSGQASRFRLARESAGPTRGGLARLPCDHLVTAHVLGGRLRVFLSFDARPGRREQVEALACAYKAALEELVAHCRAPEAGGYTPSDFPLARLERAQLARLFGRERELEDLYPLSPMQQGLLFHSLYEPGSGVYVEQLSCAIEGGLDLDAFRRAWEHLLERHAILRTAFLWEGLEQPLQAVRRDVTLPLSVLDWRERPAAEQDALWAQLVSEDRRRDFDLSRAPLMRLCVARLSEDRLRFCWSFHHALQDGWSGPILLQELVGCYQAYAQGREPRLEPACPYRDYIAWLQRQDVGAAEAFWRHELRGFTAPTPLGVERTRDQAGADGPTSGVTTVDLTDAQTRAIDTALRERGLTLATLMNGAWGLLLGRYSGEREVVFGATVSGRPSELQNIERTVGLFINTLPVRVSLAPGESVAAWLARLQQRQTEARQYDYTPLLLVQGWSELARTTPLFQTIVALQNYPNTVGGGGGGGSRPAAVLSDIAIAEETNYPISLLVMPRTRMRVQLTYDRRVLADAVVARMARHLANLFVELAAGLDRPLGAVSMLAEADRSRLLGEWVATDTDYLARPGVVELFERQVCARPAAEALACGDTRWTYAELGRRAALVANELRARGVGPEVRVALLMERSADVLAAIFGVLQAGGAYVPLDPSYPQEWLCRALADLDATVLITTGTSAAVATVSPERVLRLDADGWARLAATPPAPVRSLAEPDNAAYVIFTSGSTGVPKGVVVTRRGLANFVHAGIADHTPIGTYLLLSSFAFDSSICGIFWTLCDGQRLCVPAPGFQADAEGLAQIIADEHVTHLLCVPSLYGLLIEHAEPQRLRSLDTVIVAGDACPASLVARHRAVLPGVILSNEYGPTEATCWSTTYDTAAHDGGAHVPIGRPIANVRTYIVDGSLDLVPPGARGELLIGGVNVSRGYLNRPDLTAERFVPDPFGAAPGARLYRSGDAVRHREDGEIEFFGRIDGQVKVRGFRIELGEIEAVLRRHAGVAEAAVLARGEGGAAALVAYVVPAPAAGEDLIAALERSAHAALPGFMVPAEFVTVAAMPRTSNGKLDRRALERLHERAPASTDAAPPEGPLDARLLEIWREVFKRPDLPAGSHFFESGGHSLLAVNLVARVSREFGVRLRLSALFEAPTVAQLAERLRRELSGSIREQFAAAASGVLVPLRTQGDLPPLFCVHPRGGTVFCYNLLAQLLAPNQPVYGLQPLGLAGGDEPHRRIEDMAACYVAAIRSAQPEGPYRLSGWSLGGLIAFEMAQQLLGAGQEVAFLGLIDTHNIALDRAPEGVDDVSALMRAFGKGLHLSAERLEGLSAGEQRRYVLECARAARLDPNLLDHLERPLMVWQAEGEAARRYVPVRYAGEITLFRAAERDDTVRAIAGDDLGWGGLGRLRVREVPGDHNSVLKPPHVQALARGLAEELHTAGSAGMGRLASGEDPA